MLTGVEPALASGRVLLSALLATYMSRVSSPRKVKVVAPSICSLMQAANTVTVTSPPQTPPVEVKVLAMIATTNLHHPEGVKVVEVMARRWMKAISLRRRQRARSQLATKGRETPQVRISGRGRDEAAQPEP